MQQTDLSVVWFSDGKRRLKVPQRIIDKIFRYEQRVDRKESGGILLGLIFKDYDEILELGNPSKSDKSSLFSFLRRKKPAQRKINQAWNNSGGYLVYLGEWHTHPKSHPSPSEQDREMIENALRTTLMELNYLYLIIAGGNKSIYIGRQDRKGLKTLRPGQKELKEPNYCPSHKCID